MVVTTTVALQDESKEQQEEEEVATAAADGFSRGFQNCLKQVRDRVQGLDGRA